MATKKKKKWSFLAYIAGDNNLSDAGLEDISELCKAGTNENVHAAVQIDTYGEHDGSVRYEITEKEDNGEAFRTVIARLRESDSGNPAVLQSFVKWGINRYPAEHRLIVIWNHGSGFRSVRRDIGYDDFGSSLDMPEITTALTKAGVTPEHKLSILGFDACLMNMLEIAHHFAEHAEVLVGSQQTEPGDGWPYNDVLEAMHSAPSPGALGALIVEKYIADYEKNGQSNVTQSAVDLSRTEAAIRALDAFGKALVARCQTDRAGIRKARLAVQSYEYADYVDLIHLATLLKPLIPQVATEADAVIQATSGCIIKAGHYGKSVANSHGLSVWFPTHTSQYAQFRTKYLQLRCNGSYQGWVSFLDEYFQT